MHAQSLHGGQRELVSPRLLAGAAQSAGWRRDLVGMRDAVEAVSGLGPLPDQPLAMGHQHAQLIDAALAKKAGTP